MAVAKGSVIRPSWKKSVGTGGGGGGGVGGGGASDGLGSAQVSTSTSRASEAPFVSGVVPYEASYTNLTGTVTALQASRDVLGVVSFRMPYRGSVVGLVFTSNASKTAGTATFVVYIQGADTDATLAWENPGWGSATWLQGVFSFEAGEYVDVRATTSGFTPTTADVAVTVYCTFEPE